MNRNSLVDVVRVIKQAKRTSSPSSNFARDLECPSWRVGPMSLPMIDVGLLITGAHRKDVGDRARRINYEEDLAFEIYLRAGYDGRKFASLQHAG